MIDSLLIFQQKLSFKPKPIFLQELIINDANSVKYIFYLFKIIDL